MEDSCSRFPGRTVTGSVIFPPQVFCAFEALRFRIEALVPLFSTAVEVIHAVTLATCMFGGRNEHRGRCRTTHLVNRSCHEPALFVANSNRCLWPKPFVVTIPSVRTPGTIHMAVGAISEKPAVFTRYGRGDSVQYEVEVAIILRI